MGAVGRDDVSVTQRGHSGDVCDLVSTFCRYDLRKGNLFAFMFVVMRSMGYN